MRLKINTTGVYWQKVREDLHDLKKKNFRNGELYRRIL